MRPIGAADHITASSQQWVGKYFDGTYFADSLAAAGYVVIVPDALYWGGRSSEDAQKWSRLTFGETSSAGPQPASGPASGREKSPAGPQPASVGGGGSSADVKAEIKRLKSVVYEGQTRIYDSLAAQGVVWAERILEEDKTAAALLATLPYVDPERIGAFGFSMGAHRAWLLAAFSEHIRCAAAVCWMTTLSVYDPNSPSDLSMRIPSLREKMDFPDIAQYLAPRPMLFINGKSDPLFPEASVREAFEVMQGHYAAATPASSSTQCGGLDGSQDGDLDGYLAGASFGGRAEQNPTALQTIFVEGGHHCGHQVQTLVLNFFNQTLK